MRKTPDGEKKYATVMMKVKRKKDVKKKMEKKAEGRQEENEK